MALCTFKAIRCKESLRDLSTSTVVEIILTSLQCVNKQTKLNQTNQTNKHKEQWFSSGVSASPYLKSPITKGVCI